MPWTLGSSSDNVGIRVPILGSSSFDLGISEILSGSTDAAVAAAHSAIRARVSCGRTRPTTVEAGGISDLVH